ncbi:hypothetical protein B9J78_05865 [bacterium Unc6]|nr:hypothetical protein [bacterium Unc6]
MVPDFYMALRIFSVSFYKDTLFLPYPNLLFVSILPEVLACVKEIFFLSFPAQNSAYLRANFGQVEQRFVTTT